MRLISVIVVCYNESRERIRYTLDSIIEQDYPGLELIVIDGGSDIETTSSMKMYQNKINTFISERDDGLYDAMNKGISICTGKWILFMNIGDRLYSPCVLSKVMNHVHKENYDLICGDVHIGRKILRAPEYLSRHYLYNRTICHQALLVRRVVFDSVGFFDLSYSLIADRDWIFRAVTKGHRYTHVQMPICDWEVGGKCADSKTVDKELRRYHLKYYSPFERIMYTIIWGFSKILGRFRSLNFALPVRLRDSFRGTKKKIRKGSS
jgi:glycosyltransferase involved in cell wall biosynthesis